MSDCFCTSHSGFLTKAGYALVAQQYSLEGLAPRGEVEYFDRVGSVSALAEAEGSLWLSDRLTDEQDRRAANGL